MEPPHIRDEAPRVYMSLFLRSIGSLLSLLPFTCGFDSVRFRFRFRFRFPFASVEDCKPIEINEATRWKPKSLDAKTKGGDAEGDGSGKLSTEQVLMKANAVLNKVCMYVCMYVSFRHDLVSVARFLAPSVCVFVRFRSKETGDNPIQYNTIQYNKVWGVVVPCYNTIAVGLSHTRQQGRFVCSV